MNWQVGLYLLAILVPLLAFLVEIFGLRIIGRHNAWIATGAVGFSFLLSLIGFIDYFGFEAKGVFSERPVKQKVVGDLHPERSQGPSHPRDGDPLAWTGSFDWVSVGAAFEAPGKTSSKLDIPLSLRLDNLTVLMVMLVTFVATVVHVYSLSYMKDDPRAPLYFAYLSLFVVSMLGLLVAANLLVVFIFWELVGLCSYLLIGFWRDEKGNGDAANKAFLVNRVGDVGLLLGIGLIWTSLGTLDIATLNRSLRDDQGEFHRVETGAGPAFAMVDRATSVPLTSPTGSPLRIATWGLGLAGLGVLAGAAGKSAQFPLHVWLPDAMAGPTPVSALIHAATMVAAGVYLVARVYPIFTDEVRLLMAYLGGITLLIGATVAVVQTDYKKVLAYSTISQLGFMMLALGVGGWAAGLFHLATHACFKALLFLGAGSLYQAVHTYEMRKLGGLSRKLPITAITMLIGTLAISGVPFLSGFYSKDAILASALYRLSEPGGAKHILLFVLPVVGSALTSFYMFRMWFLCFGGESRSLETTGHAHESDPFLTWPLIALAVPSVFLGWTIWLGLPIGEPILEQMIAYGEPIPSNDIGASHLYAMIASILVATAGMGAGVAYYAPPLPYVFRRRFRVELVATRFRRFHTFLTHKWYIDEIYQAFIIKPTLCLANDLNSLDRFVIDPIVNGFVSITERLSRLQKTFDRVGIDGLVTAFVRMISQIGDLSRRLQTGRLRHYLLVMALAMVSLGFLIFAWVQ